ncbi:MAG: serine/threonine protein kinase [Halobacteriovoraceae bacterium]|nr:serine/threonine protein kinase [Halobacteriovoraceae bacterium]|tara:strand:+ start:4399 stop:5148 length:750 start_codon:yes stop_codon:yes gene_type:complete
MQKKKTKSINEFNFPVSKRIGNRYIILEKLGAGWEGEVYKVLEVLTKRQRAIKLFYPQRNVNFKVSTRYAQKLDKLKDCPIIMNYHSHELITFKGQKVACLTSELIEGELLDDFVKYQRGKRLSIFPAIHLLYSLVKGVESIHLNGEYHGDIHTGNVIIRKFGLSFDIKLIDLHHWGDSKKDNRDEDIIKIIRLFYDILGGKARYAKLPPSIKYIVCGLKRGLILERFKSISHLRVHLEAMDWSDAIEG